MRGRRELCGPPPALAAAAPEPHGVKPQRTNRLSRSFRLSQAAVPVPVLGPGPVPLPVLGTGPEDADPPRNERPEFKTPTRVPRSKPAAVFSQESPHNDCDVQHDIIWDATSPSPRRPGKRGKRITTGAVNISDIVSRIAPEHGRPQVSEPTLQQWIGDSATIPCTPDVQAPRAKKKSPRPNGVDDLLRLARQFDLNLFHQGEDQDQHRQSPDLPTEDVPHLETELPSSLPGSCRTAVSLDPRPSPDQQPEDDLDFLFDGPTQQVSGPLSPDSPAASRFAPTARGPTSGSRDAFEDDWENDDLLNDSLVLEMTQNPQTFAVPRLCSTQKASGQAGRRETSAPVVGPGVQKENLKPRATFRLESNPRKVWQEPSRSAVETGPQTRKPEPLRPHTNRRTSAQNFSQNPPVVSSTVDFLDDDLESFFSSEPVWDDPADDDLLCEICADLENQIWTGNDDAPPSSNQRTAPQPTHRTAGDRVQALAVLPVPVGRVDSVKSSQQPYGFTRPKPVSGGGLGGSRPPPQRSDTFSFRTPSGLVSMATNEASGKCSAAEIELKKRRAMERRRQRLQAAASDGTGIT